MRSLQILVKVVDMPVVVQRQVSLVLTVQKTVEIPQMQILEMPVVVQRQVPLVLTVLKPVEIPHLQVLDKVVVMPFVVQRQVPPCGSPWRFQIY